MYLLIIARNDHIFVLRLSRRFGNPSLTDRLETLP